MMARIWDHALYVVLGGGIVLGLGTVGFIIEYVVHRVRSRA